MISAPGIAHDLQSRAAGLPSFIVAIAGAPASGKSAIAYFTAWFKSELGEDVSKSSISPKLKTYYDELVRKKTEK